MNPSNQLGLMGAVGYPGTKASVTSTGMGATPYAGQTQTYPGLNDYIKGQQNQIQTTQSAINALNAEYAKMYNAQPKPAYYNSGAAYTSAMKQGGAQADALYNKQLNELNTQMAAQQQGAQQQQELSNSVIHHRPKSRRRYLNRA